MLLGYVFYWSRGSVVGILPTGWTTEEAEFESLQGQECLLLHIVKIGSAVHPIYYPVDNRGSFQGGKEAGT
jgi:hypothetical protein